jgi:hypothetical protein
VNTSSNPGATRATEKAETVMANKYSALTAMLLAAAKRGDAELTFRFDDLDGQIPGGLPPSARKYREWWSNSGQPHSVAWRRAGWRVDAVNQASGMWVRFELEPVGQAPRIAARLPARTEPERQPFGSSPQQVRPNEAAPALLPSLEASGSHIDSFDVRLVVEWRLAGDIELDASGGIVFPTVPNVHGLYRITRVAVGSQARPRVYIGEAELLSRRMMGYRSPGPTQTTNIKMHGALVEHLRSGGRATLDISTTCKYSLSVGGLLVSLSLARKSARLLAESAAVVAATGYADLDNACEASHRDELDPAA